MGPAHSIVRSEDVEYAPAPSARASGGADRSRESHDGRCGTMWMEKRPAALISSRSGRHTDRAEILRSRSSAGSRTGIPGGSRVHGWPAKPMGGSPPLVSWRGSCARGALLRGGTRQVQRPRRTAAHRPVPRPGLSHRTAAPHLSLASLARRVQGAPPQAAAEATTRAARHGRPLHHPWAPSSRSNFVRSQPGPARSPRSNSACCPSLRPAGPRCTRCLVSTERAAPCEIRARAGRRGGPARAPPRAPQRRLDPRHSASPSGAASSRTSTNVD